MSTVINARDVLLQAAPSRYSNPPNAAILLVSSSPVFHIANGGAFDPASITFTASLIGLAGPVTFVATGGTLAVAGNVATLTYANMPGSTASVKATLTENGQSYESNLCFATKVLDGVNGTNGTTGLNNARVFAYQRAAAVPTLSPGDVTVTFASNSITAPAALLNGWVRDIPTANGTPLYVTAISGAGTAATVDLLAASWSGAAVMATDGPGGTGTNGTNGLNAATIMIFQRSASATALTKPSVDTTYTFATGVVAGLNNGWTQGVPANDPAKPYLQTTLATAVSASATDTVPASEWATVQLLYDAAAVIAAQATADAAAISATTANTALDNIFADNVLSRDEKADLVRRWAEIQGEYVQIGNQADSLTVSKTAYFASVDALAAYLTSIPGGWGTTSVNSSIVRVDANTAWNNYYSAKVSILNAIAAKIKVDAAADATAKASAAQAAAIAAAAIAAQTKADLAQVTAEAYADGIVTAEEARAIADATAKASAAQAAAVAAAAADATAKANAAQATAIATAATAAQAKADLAEITAKAYADGIVDAEEARAIADATTKANTAQAAATAAAVAADAAIVIGGRNSYSKTSPLEDLGTGSTAPFRNVTGFTLKGINAATGVIRLKDVITKNGIWTVSFDLAVGTASGHPLAIDVCDSPGQTINPTTATQHFSLTFTVSNWSAVTYNFIDFGGLSNQDYYFGNFKVEAGTKETTYTPSPEDVAADATDKANAAQAAAISTAATAAQTKADLAEVTAKAYADGIVTAEEARAIADATAKANAAQVAATAAAAADATAKANVAATTSNWSGVANNDGSRPANGATVGAPSGTNVAGVSADTLVSQAASGATAATKLATPITGRGAGNAMTALSASRQGSGILNMGTRTAVGTGGTGPYIYAWTLDGDPDITISSGASTATPSFRAFGSTGDIWSSIARCVITDTSSNLSGVDTVDLGATYT